jgi:hypothetical protein
MVGWIVEKVLVAGKAFGVLTEDQQKSMQGFVDGREAANVVEGQALQAMEDQINARKRNINQLREQEAIEDAAKARRAAGVRAAGGEDAYRMKEQQAQLRVQDIQYGRAFTGNQNLNEDEAIFYAKEERARIQRERMAAATPSPITQPAAVSATSGAPPMPATSTTGPAGTPAATAPATVGTAAGTVPPVQQTTTTATSAAPVQTQVTVKIDAGAAAIKAGDEIAQAVHNMFRTMGYAVTMGGG